MPEYVTPAVKRIAAARGVDLTTIEGTGAAGRIRTQDVVRAAPAPRTPVAGPPSDQPFRTPKVRKLAAQHGVDLAKVAGTGRDGRVREADVLFAAGAGPAPVAASRAPVHLTPPSGPYSRNPVAAEARARNRAGVVRASSTGVAEPALFGAADLPVATASGLDPQALLSVPWQARPAVAAATTQPEAYKLLQTYSGPEAPEAAAWDFRDVEQDLRHRHGAWVVDSMTEAELHESVHAMSAHADPHQARRIGL